MMEQSLLDLMRNARYRPMNKSELARALDLSPQERPALRQALKKLEAQGAILRGKRGRYVLEAKQARTLTGIFRRRGSGPAEVWPDKGTGKGGRGREQKVLVPYGFAGTALDGDQVLVRLKRPSEPHWLRHLPKHSREKVQSRLKTPSRQQEAEVLKVLKRKPRRIVGVLQGTARFGSFLPDDPDFPSPINLPQGLPGGARNGDKALVTIETWESVQQAPTGRILEVLGPAGAPGMDILSIIHRHELRVAFSQEALDEAEAKARPLTTADLAGREDRREDEVITIDPFDARDFDDAIAVKHLDGGHWELAVHIADVSHYVRPGSPLDIEARRRGNSVYLVDRVLPMLPEALSNGICSLKPDEERLTMCATMRFDAKGRMTGARFFPSVIRSRRRLTYEEAYARLQSKAPNDEVTDLLTRAWELASILRRRRFRKGSLDLDFPETKVILNDSGRPVELRLIEYDESHQLIEEFMLAANEAVATVVLEAQRPSLYRVHEDPDPEKLYEFREMVLLHGYQVGDLTDRQELQSLFRQMRGKADEHRLKLHFLKSLKRAVYHENPLGHYGLRKENYTHFTSPIRRYTDLVVHRVLRKIVDASVQLKTPTQAVMGDLAEHLSETERRAADAEMQSKRLKEVEYFEILSRERPPRRFQAVVTDVARIGLFVELQELQTRGLIRVEDLPPGDYRFDPARLRYTGSKGQVYKLGDVLDVTVAGVNKERLFIDFRVWRKS